MVFVISNALGEEQLIDHYEKKHSNMKSQKRKGNYPETHFKVTEDCDQTRREFKIVSEWNLTKGLK